MTAGSRVPESADAATLRALTATRSATRTMSDALLTHVPDLGDLPTQRALDAWVEQAADTLRALSETVEERLLDLGSRRAGTAVDTSPDPAPRTTGARRWDDR
jgi:hypothetical protein